MTGRFWHRVNVSIPCSTLIKQRARCWIEKHMENAQIQRTELQAKLNVIRSKQPLENCTYNGHIETDDKSVIEENRIRIKVSKICGC